LLLKIPRRFRHRTRAKAQGRRVIGDDRGVGLRLSPCEVDLLEDGPLKCASER